MLSKKYLTVLSNEDVHQIHLATLQVLEEVGLWLPNSEVLQILEGAGAKVDFKKQVARYGITQQGGGHGGSHAYLVDDFIGLNVT